MAIKDETGIIINEVNESGLITSGEFTVAIPTTANKFAAGCVLVGNDGKTYTNSGTSASPSFQDINSISLSELSSGIAASHIIKFFRLGSTITTTTLAGVVAGDLVVSILADGTSTVGVVVTPDTLPADPADDTYVIVLRATA